MPSPLPPTIGTAKGSDGKDVANNGTLASDSITFTGKGFPGLRINITLSVNGASSPPSTLTANIDSTGSWSATLNNFPSGAIVVTFTEDATGLPGSAPNGAVSWAFTVQTGITENFDDCCLTQYYDFEHRVVTKKRVSVLYNSKNPGSIRYTSEFLDDSNNPPIQMQGRAIFLNYYPRIASSPATLGFSLYQPKIRLPAQCKEISFWYISQNPCEVIFYNTSGTPVGQSALLVSPKTAQQVKFTASNVSTFGITDSSGIIAPKIEYSVGVSSIIFTPV